MNPEPEKDDPPEEIPADSTEGRLRLAAARVLRKRADAMVTGAKGVLDVSDPRPAGRYRLATGRMLAALDLFEPCLAETDRRSCREEVTQIAEATAARRDVDAVVGLCESVKAEMAEGPAEGLEQALEQLRDRQADLNRTLAGRIHGRRLEALKVRLGDLADRAADPVSGEHNDSSSAPSGVTGAVRDSLRDQMARLRDLATAALEPENRDEQHRLADAAAELRYSLELTAAAIGTPAQKARRAARSLQEILGELRDTDLACPPLAEALATLENEDVQVVTERGRGGSDLDPVLVLAAPNRAAYQGCHLALVHARARRQVMSDRFRRLWLEQSRQGVWPELEAALADRHPD